MRLSLDRWEGWCRMPTPFCAIHSHLRAGQRRVGRVEEASLSPPEAPRSLRNLALSGLLLIGSLLLCFVVLEIAVRLFVDLDTHRL